MLYIGSDNSITLTRGDTLTLTVILKKDGQTYTPEEGDSLRFAVSKQYLTQAGYELKFAKDIPLDTLTFTCTSEETSLPYTTYNYDVEITHADGCIDTVLSSKLTITGEVK